MEAEKTTVLNTALSDIIQGAVSSASSAKQFLLEQAPDVICQLVMWKTCEYAALAIMFALLASVGFVFLKKGINTLQKDSDDGIGICCVAFGGCAFVGFTIGAIVNIFDFLQIYIAPKVWLLEYAVDLVKTHR